MGRPAVKKNRKEAEAKAYGELIGKHKALKHIKIADTIKMKLIDMIDKVDPIKLAAIGSTAYILKVTIIDGLSDFLNERRVKGGSMPFLNERKIRGYLDIPEGVDLKEDELFKWLIAFSAAYILLEKPEIVTDITSLIKNMVGAIV